MTVTWKDVSDAIVAKLDGIADLGRIYDYPLSLLKPADIREHCMVNDPASGKDIVNVIFVGRSSVRDERGGTPAGIPLTEANRIDTFKLSFHYGFAESGQTATKFQNIVEDIMNEFLPDITLVDETTIARAMAATSIGFLEFGNMLCHSAEFELTVERRRAVNYE